MANRNGVNTSFKPIKHCFYLLRVLLNQSKSRFTQLPFILSSLDVDSVPSPARSLSLSTTFTFREVEIEMSHDNSCIFYFSDDGESESAEDIPFYDHPTFRIKETEKKVLLLLLKSPSF